MAAEGIERSPLRMVF